MTATGRPIAFAANDTARAHFGSTKMVSAREITRKTVSSVKAKAPNGDQAARRIKEQEEECFGAS